MTRTVSMLTRTLAGATLAFGLGAASVLAADDAQIKRGAEVYTASFPSGHSMMAAVVYLTLGALLARTQVDRVVKAYILAVAVIVTVLVGVSRVYLGVHWPTDVLAGWALGAAWALTCWLVMTWLQARGQVEGEVKR